MDSGTYFTITAFPLVNERTQYRDCKQISFIDQRLDKTLTPLTPQCCYLCYHHKAKVFQAVTVKDEIKVSSSKLFLPINQVILERKSLNRPPFSRKKMYKRESRKSLCINNMKYLQQLDTNKNANSYGNTIYSIGATLRCSLSNMLLPDGNLTSAYCLSEETAEDNVIDWLWKMVEHRTSFRYNNNTGNNIQAKDPSDYIFEDNLKLFW